MSAASFIGGESLSTEQMVKLRRHVVNLNAGEFSQDGQFATFPEDVRAIFEQHLPRWERQSNQRLTRIALYVHGGLVSERYGIRHALDQIDIWLQNGIYPIYFVWESGFWESCQQLLTGRTREVDFDVRFFGATRDRVLEEIARRLGPKLIWEGMKRSAELAFSFSGGGRETVRRLLRFVRDRKDVKIHTVAHSAGSIFWAHGLSYGFGLGLRIESMHFLAPAITSNLFHRKLLRRVGRNRNIKQLTVYTMRDAVERDDTVGPYGKSLLYLIHNALEPERETPILGLETSIRRDHQLQRFFGMDGFDTEPPGSIVWSPTPQSTGRNASRARAHGDFDNDSSTLNSVLRRVLQASDTDPIVPFPPGQRSEFRHSVSQSKERMDESMSNLTMFEGSSRGGVDSESHSSNRQALCIGIDQYPNPGDRLGGCVNDANNWKNWFQGNGFRTQMLTDGQATRSGIINSIESLISGSRAGDVIAIQYSGHGTQVTDFGTDESDGLDEALVPYDHRDNGYLDDDVIALVCNSIPSGVNVSFFLDCCHSGSSTRFLIGGAHRGRSDMKIRFLAPDAEMLECHRRTSQNRARRSRSAEYANRPEILFAACGPHQTAKERNGQGDFSRYALQVLNDTGGTLTNSGFIQRVSQVGSFFEQDPKLWSDSGRQNQSFLGSLTDRPLASCGDNTRGLIRELRAVLDRWS